MSIGEKRGNAASMPETNLGDAEALRDPDAMRARFREDNAARARYIRNSDAAFAARNLAAEGAASLIDAQLRTVAALWMAGEEDPSAGACDCYQDHRQASLSRLTGLPALTARDLTRKLAALVAEVLTLSSVPDTAVLTLAASALVDAVLLESGPIDLPRYPIAAVPVAPSAGSAEA